MPSMAPITNDPLLFDKLLAPIEAVLQRLDAEPLSQAAKKLRFRLFVRVLLFRLFAQIQSLGLLVVDLQTAPNARCLDLPRLSLSTLHDAFARYPHGHGGPLAGRAGCHHSTDERRSANGAAGGRILVWHTSFSGRDESL